jgi:hypothetical protein
MEANTWGRCYQAPPTVGKGTSAVQVQITEKGTGVTPLAQAYCRASTEAIHFPTSVSMELGRELSLTCLSPGGWAPKGSRDSYAP